MPCIFLSAKELLRQNRPLPRGSPSGSRPRRRSLSPSRIRDGWLRRSLCRAGRTEGSIQALQRLSHRRSTHTHRPSKLRPGCECPLGEEPVPLTSSLQRFSATSPSTPPPFPRATEPHRDRREHAILTGWRTGMIGEPIRARPEKDPSWCPGWFTAASQEDTNEALAEPGGGLVVVLGVGVGRAVAARAAGRNRARANRRLHHQVEGVDDEAGLAVRSRAVGGAVLEHAPGSPKAREPPPPVPQRPQDAAEDPG